MIKIADKNYLNPEYNEIFCLLIIKNFFGMKKFNYLGNHLILFVSCIWWSRLLVLMVALARLLEWQCLVVLLVSWPKHRQEFFLHFVVELEWLVVDMLVVMEPINEKKHIQFYLLMCKMQVQLRIKMLLRKYGKEEKLVYL